MIEYLYQIHYYFCAFVHTVAQPRILFPSPILNHKAYPAAPVHSGPSFSGLGLLESEAGTSLLCHLLVS